MIRLDILSGLIWIQTVNDCFTLMELMILRTKLKFNTSFFLNNLFVQYMTSTCIQSKIEYNYNTTTIQTSWKKSTYFFSCWHDVSIFNTVANSEIFTCTMEVNKLLICFVHCKQFGPLSDPTFCRARSGSNLINSNGINDFLNKNSY